jgi:PAS domain S-box-containing protein
VSTERSRPLAVPPEGRRSLAQRGRDELEHAAEIHLSMPWSVVMGAALGAGAVAIKFGLNEVADGETGYIVMVAAALLAAWFGGRAAGLVSTLVAVALNHVLFISPLTLDGADRVEIVREVTFVVVCVGCVVLVASRRASRDRLAASLVDVAKLADGIEARDRRLELMLSASGTGFWEWDILSGDLTWSDAIFEQHGLQPGDTAPEFEAYQDLIHPDDRTAFETGIQHALDTQGTFDLEFRVLWPDGSIHWAHAFGRAFVDGTGRPVRMIGTGQDITRHKSLESERDQLIVEERHAAEFREAFIDVISHELRTPITTILGTTELLARPGRIVDPAVRSAMLEDTRAESERLFRMVEDLLVLSRVERDRLVVDAEPLHLRRLVEQVVVHAAAGLPSIHVSLELPAELPIVSGEASYVEQILRNLLENAAKYSPPGSAVIVRAVASDESVTIHVIDEGPGIPEASLPHVFELFYRDPSVVRTASGSGIGLFVSQRLAEAMGGQLTVRRQVERGAELLFELPVLASDPDDELVTSHEVDTGRSRPIATSL